MVAEEKSIMDWSTMFLTFLVGSSFTLVAVLALVLKTSRREVSGSLLGNTERKRCKEPSSFGGRTEDFAEWLFSVQEALRTLQPADPVGYVASFLEGNARKWLISSWGPDGSRRPRDWLEFKSQLTNAFAEKDAEEWHRTRLIKTRQSGNLEEYITRFAGSSLLVPALDELTKVTLFVEGLSSLELKKEVRREHPKSLSEATRAARTACLNQECNSDPYANANDAGEQVAPRRAAVRRSKPNWASRPEQLSPSERSDLFRRRLCFRCRKPGHIAANCPSASSSERHPRLTGVEQAPAEVGVLTSSTRFVNSLLIVKVVARGREAKALIDSGATHSFVSEMWVEKSNVPTYFTGQMITATLADGRRQVIRERKTKDQEWRIGDFCWQEPLTVIPLQPRYDIVLGKPWLAAHNPDIDFSRNIVHVCSGKRTHCLLAAEQDEVSRQDEDPHPLAASTCNVEFMNIQQARKAIKRGAGCIFVNLKSVSNVEPEEEERSGFIENSISDNLDHIQRRDLQQLLNRHEKCFRRDLPMKLPPARRTDHEIKVEEGSRPPSRPPFRMSAPELDELQRQLQQLLDHGFIETSNSPYGAPVFFVKKADGSLRLVCDWRALNKITTKVQACLPNIDDLFDCVRGAKYFSKLDLKSGYHQVRIKDEDVSKTAINTPFGQFQFRVMGFGLTNAPATFMSVMNDVLRPFLRKSVIIFLDDILVFSRSWREHLHQLDAVLLSLEQESLFCNPVKCQFGLYEVKFLGHVVSGSRLSPDPDKLEAVAKWPVPRTVTDVRRFLGFTNFFRRFIEDYSAMSRSLERLTGKQTKFTWSTEQQEGFNKLRQALLKAPVLMIADVHRPFRVVSDASDTAIGAVLLQQDDAGEWHPVAYTSRRFRPEESNYTIMERETLAAIHALRVWRLYLFNHFELATDNQGVVYLNSKKNLTKREARSIEFLADYDVEIVHRPGKENMADPLSRITDEGNDQVNRCSESHSCLATDSNNDEDAYDVLSDVGGTEVSICAEPKFKGLLAEGYSKDKKMKRTIDRLKRNPKLEDPYFWNSLEERLYLRTDGRQRSCVFQLDRFA